MKVMLRARGLCSTIEDGTRDEQEDQMAMKAILKAVPPEFISALGSEVTAKKAWEKLTTLRLNGDRVRKAKAQQLRREYEAIAFRNDEAVEDFALQLTSLVNQLAVLGDKIGEEEVVAKYLRVVPAKFAQIALSIGTLLDLSELSIEDVTGRLKAVEEWVEAPTQVAGDKLLLTEEWAARVKERQGESSSVPSKGGGVERPRQASEEERRRRRQGGRRAQ